MNSSTPTAPRRTVRSFVQRAGRITRAQERALEALWPQWGVEFSAAPLDLDQLFGRKAPKVLEIGIGDGETLLALAAAHPECDFLGAEVHRPGIGHCLLGIESRGLANVRLVAHDAVEVLEHQLPDAVLDEVLLYFPDPWPKKRHHKRRIVQPAFVGLVARKLKPGGRFRLATDWAPYAQHMLDVLRQSPVLGMPRRRATSCRGQEAVPRPASSVAVNASATRCSTSSTGASSRRRPSARRP